jgi:2-polyprenyl-6-hydroxyphenyl methylase/3-demethylubiquinone-9 3-methyltransferase
MIWLLEDILKQLPQGLHDWNKFIKPQELKEIMERVGFADILIKGFDVTDGTNFNTLRDIMLKGLTNQREGKKSNLFKIQINEDTSVCYIGKAVKR